MDPKLVSWHGELVYLLGWDVHSRVETRSLKTIGSKNQEIWFLFSAGHLLAIWFGAGTYSILGLSFLICNWRGSDQILQKPYAF